MSNYIAPFDVISLSFRRSDQWRYLFVFGEDKKIFLVYQCIIERSLVPLLSNIQWILEPFGRGTAYECTRRSLMRILTWAPRFNVLGSRFSMKLYTWPESSSKRKKNKKEVEPHNRWFKRAAPENRRCSSVTSSSDEFLHRCFNKEKNRHESHNESWPFVG